MGVPFGIHIPTLLVVQRSFLVTVLIWNVRTNGAAGVIPSTLKYVTEFISQDPERE